MGKMVLFAVCVVAPALTAFAEDLPKSLDPRLKVELFAEHPQIVTPTGIDVDHRGRVFAIESNTHFPPEGYQGHPTDRVLVMSDTDGDGKADRIVVFKDGLRHSMSVAVRPLWFPVSGKAPAAGESTKPAGDSAKPSAAGAVPHTSIYIATRREIFLFHDDDGDDQADRQESIVHLDTKGDYPHNGLAGFAIDALGWMYFGFGENLGADYGIIGSDGTTLSGGGEGGNIYRCRLDGSKLSRIATGFWNPHANCFDAFGRLFSVDNDPDSRPPCRLLHVIPGGDYGYRFRNGRKGLHPFTAWNGEIPGTLPMVAGTGEAPSGIVAYESDGLPEEYLGNLLVTSWGDHRIDRFRLQPKGTSFTSLAEPLITGGENFRPVGLATAPDGSLFCTDWVLRDYKLHGHGRIWRIAPKELRAQPPLDITAFSGLEDTRLQSLLSSPRRDVRRMVARVLFERAQIPERRLLEMATTQVDLRGNIEMVWASARTWAENNPERVNYDSAIRGWSSEMPLISRDPKLTNSSQRLWVNTQGLANPTDMIARYRSGADSHRFDHDLLLPILGKIPPDRLRDQNILKLALSLDDPFVFSVMTSIIANHFSQDDFSKYLIPDATPDVKASGPRVRQAMLLAARQQAPKDDRLLRVALADPDPDVRRLAVQWAAEEKLTELRPKLEAMFGPVREGEAPAEPRTAPKPGSAGASPSQARAMTPELFLATLAALEMLDGRNPADFDKTPAEQYVVPLLKDEKRSPAVRAQALRLVSPADKSLDAPFFASLLKSGDDALRLEAIRTLQLAPPDVSGSLLRELAASDSLDEQLRAEALVGLAAVAKSEPVGGPSRKLLMTFLSSTSPAPLRLEALRAARPLIASDAELRQAVLAVAETLDKLSDGDAAMNLADQIALAASEAKLAPLPSSRLKTSDRPKTREDWLAQLNRGRDADPAAGRRVFFHPNGPGCFRCHTIDGRGGRIGPDLSRAVGTMNRIQLIQSILEPSREISPQYVSWVFELQDGRVVTGMVVHENEGKTVVGDAEGRLTEIRTIDIETRTPQKVSVMPDKLAERMTLQELRDLLAYLDASR